MGNKTLHGAAVHISSKLNIYARASGLDLVKMVYGTEIFLINITKLAAVYSIAAILGTLGRTLIIHLAFMLIKRYSFGLHALSSLACTVISVCFFVGVPYFTAGVGIGNAFTAILFTFVVFSLYRYAPADTKATPIIGKLKRRVMKKKAVYCGMALAVLALAIPNGQVKLLLALGAVFQCVLLHPFMYKILKRSEKNYEAYENVGQ